MNDFEKRFYALMITLPEDTTPERIKSNREKMLPLIAEAEKNGYTGKAVDEAIDLYYYFDTGRKPVNSIDGLHDRLKKSLAEGGISYKVINRI